MAAYLTKVESELSKKEFENICYSFRPLRKLSGHTQVEQFGPKALKQVRQTMIDEGLARKVINQRVGRIKRLFKYGVSEELVSSSVLHALQSVDGLRFGRTEAPEKDPILPVADEQVDLVMPFFSHVTAAKVKLQRLTGMRPGEVCRMRIKDIDMSGEVWLYKPPTHKTHLLGKSRTILIGPLAQAVLQPFLDRPADAYLFTPHESYVYLREKAYATRGKIYSRNAVRGNARL